MSVLSEGGALVLMPHEFDSAVATADIPRPGLVLAEDTDNAGQVVVAAYQDKGFAVDDSKKVGIALTSTKDREGTAQTGVVVGFIPLETGAKARVALYQSNVTITVGDALIISSVDAGYVDKHAAWTSVVNDQYTNLLNQLNLVGFACEAKGENQGTGASILLRVERGSG